MQTKIQTANIDSLEKEYDLVIVGSGATGLVSALQAKRLGLKVAVIEKMA
ncbi:FAD-binding protein, partial [Ligilactobacillus agilis]